MLDSSPNLPSTFLQQTLLIRRRKVHITSALPSFTAFIVTLERTCTCTSQAVLTKNIQGETKDRGTIRLPSLNGKQLQTVAARPVRRSQVTLPGRRYLP